MAKACYLPEDTYYLTNQGLKQIPEFSKDTSLLALKNSKITYTKDFEVNETYFDTMQQMNCGSFYGLISSIESDIKNNEIHLDFNKEPNQVRFQIKHDAYSDFTISRAQAIALTLFISTYFKSSKNKIVSIPQFHKRIYKVFSTVNNLLGIYFNWNNITNNYVLSYYSFFKSPDLLEQLLLNNIDMFSSILDALQEFNCIVNDHGYSFIGFKNYRLACLFASLLTLNGFKAKVKFNKDSTTFNVTFTKNKSRKVKSCTETLYYSNSICGYSISSSEDNTYLVVAQKVNDATVFSIISISKKILSDFKPVNASYIGEFSASIEEDLDSIDIITDDFDNIGDDFDG